MGSQGMMASMQGYGCMGITSFYGAPLSLDAGIAILEKAFELGVTHFDSAEIYTGTDADGNTVYNEEVIGKFVAKVGRDKVTVATKFFPGGDPSAQAVREHFEASRAKLGFDCVDLYYCHRVPSVDWLKAFSGVCKELISEGKLKYSGLSEATSAEIRMAHEISPLTAIQQEWSLLIRNSEADVVPTCRELGIAIVAYSPLCRGFATGLVKTSEDWSKIGNGGGAATGFQSKCPHLSGDNAVANAKLLAPLEEQASALGVSAAQLSLAWLQRQGEDVFPIPGTTKLPNLESNIGATKLAETLSQENVDALSKGVDWKSMAGDRYPAGIMGLCHEKRTPVAAA